MRGFIFYYFYFFLLAYSELSVTYGCNLDER